MANGANIILAPRRRRRDRNGLALILVIAVIALASVLGYAMLSGATLQNRAGANQARLMQADYLAESGLNIAMYYLQNPDKAPGYPNFGGVGYWSGTGGDIAISSAVAGTTNVTVTRDASDQWTYEIVTVGKAGTNADTKVTRTTGARVYVRNQYSVKHAGAFNGNSTVGAYMTFNGDIWSSKNLGLKIGVLPLPVVTGVGYTTSPLVGVGFTSPTGGWGVPANNLNPAPSSTDLNLYKTYWYNDVQYTCDTATASTLTGVTLGTSAVNPAGVWYYKPGGTLTITGNVTVNGTLVIEGGLKIQATGATITITPKSGFPALIVTDTLEIQHQKNKLTCNGVTYIGNQLKSGGTTPLLPANYSTFAVNGALLMGNSAGGLISGYNVYTTITYDSTKALAPDITSTTQHVPRGVSILRWGLP
jgi:Tfp pilus assembly protein PilX